MPSADWDPDRYGRFATLRARPFWDLVDLVEPPTLATSPIGRVVDLGCGSGELTVELAERLGAHDVVGIDSSPAMLDRAHQLASPIVRFESGDIARWTGSDVDLVLANASLQWVPDHAEVLTRWSRAVGDDGQLAVQVPANADHPSHRCAAAVAEREPFRSAFAGDPPPDPVAANVLAPETYSELLHDLGFTDPHVRLQVYPQVLPSSRSVVDWVSGTTLTRFFATLPEDLHGQFVDAYTDELVAAIGDRTPYFYAFKRILMHGSRRRR